MLFIWGMQDAFLTPDYPLMLARMVPRGNLHVMDHASHHLQEERPQAYHSVGRGFLGARCRRSGCAVDGSPPGRWPWRCVAAGSPLAGVRKLADAATPRSTGINQRRSPRSRSSDDDASGPN